MSLFEAGNQKLVLYDNLEGKGGEGGGGALVYLRLIHTDTWQTPQYCKVVISQLQKVV